MSDDTIDDMLRRFFRHLRFCRGFFRCFFPFSEFSWFGRCSSVVCAPFSALTGPLLSLSPPGKFVAPSTDIVFGIPLSLTVTLFQLAAIALNGPVALGGSFYLSSAAIHSHYDNAYAGGFSKKTDLAARKVGIKRTFLSKYRL